MTSISSAPVNLLRRGNHLQADRAAFKQGIIDRYYDPDEPASGNRKGAIIERFPASRPLPDIQTALKRLQADGEPLDAISEDQLSAQDIFRRAMGQDKLLLTQPAVKGA
jgi:hypothetical protein